TSSCAMNASTAWLALRPSASFRRLLFFFSSRRRHTRFSRDWSSDVCSSDLFLLSIVLLGISVWIRLKLNESPLFQKMKEEGTLSKAPLKESFGEWRNMKLVLIALFGLTAGQAVIWYTGQFYSLFFLTQVLKVDGQTASLLVGAALLLGVPFFVVFGTLSDRIGRKPIIMAGCLLAMLTYFPIFSALTHYANPHLEAAQKYSPVVVIADPAECSFKF